MKKANLLVAIDLSTSSYKVLDKALELSGKVGCRLDIVHVIEESFFFKSKSKEEIYTHTCQALQKRFSGISKEQVHIRSGALKTEVSALAKELDSEMLIIGSSGESILLEEFFLGSHTKDIVRSSDIPVLVLKHYHELKYRNILFPTDFSEASKRALKQMLALFPYSKFIIYHTYFVFFENRLNVYGLDKQDATVYRDEMKHEAEMHAREFMDNFGEDASRMKRVVEKGSLNPKLFMENTRHLDADLLFLHTTGNFSFVSFDMLEVAPQDVLMLHVDE